MTKQRVEGFTLIELLIVIAIIGILSSLLFANFSSARERARDTQRKNDLNQVKTALQVYYNDFNKFPGSSGTSIAGCGALGTSACTWASGGVAGSAFSAGNPLTVYMGALPGDPQSPSQQYVYCAGATQVQSQTCSNVDYIIWTTLENGSDPDANASQTRCGVASGNIIPKVYMVCNQ